MSSSVYAVKGNFTTSQVQRLRGRRLLHARWWLALLLAPLLLVGMPLPAAERATVNQKDLDRVRARIEALNKALQKDRGQRDALDNELEITERNLAASQAALSELQSQLDARQLALRQAEGQRDAAQARLQRERTALAQQLRASYMVGERAPVKLMLSQDRASDIGRLLTYYDFLVRGRSADIKAVQTERERALSAAQVIKAETEKLAETRAQHALAIEEERKAAASRQILLAKLKERIGDEEDEIRRLRQGEQELVKLLSNIRTVLADTPVKAPPASAQTPAAKPALAGRGAMGWPLRGPLLANFGDAKVGSQLVWKGLWIAAERGATARASTAGRVAYVGYMHRYGLITIVEHEGGFFTLYGHLDSAIVHAGDSVRAGEMVGAVGDSGGHDRTGLYFEVRRGTEPIDPRSWLSP